MGDSGYRELVESGNLAIADAAMKCESVFATHARAVVSISGGADSDVMLDLCERVRQVQPIEIHYVFFDTGLEYRATLRHLDYLRERYGVNIERVRAYKSIPVACKEHGQPFLSKHVSTNCDLLQRRGFQWEDEPYEVLAERYDRCTTALKWWCNRWTRVEGKPGMFDIGRNRWLKEFMVANPPDFKISAKCCQLAKKQTSINVERERERRTWSCMGSARQRAEHALDTTSATTKGATERTPTDPCSGSTTTTSNSMTSGSKSCTRSAIPSGDSSGRDAPAARSVESLGMSWIRHGASSR